MPKTSAAEIDAILHAEHGAPRAVLGPHVVHGGDATTIVIRAFQPQAQEVWVVEVADHTAQSSNGAGASRRWPMTRTHPDGFFEVHISDRGELFPYRLLVAGHDGQTFWRDDPYAFPPLLTSYDLHLIGEGTHYQTYEKLGAHVREVRGTPGVHFAVWAPNAKRVSVVGDFNRWDRRAHPMQQRGTSGIWELFIPGLGEGALYKFQIKSRFGGYEVEKADPYGFYAEQRPATASVVAKIDDYQWHDAAWLEQRAQRDPLPAPMAIYEVHPGSWRRVPEEGNRYLTYRELAHQLVPYVKDLGYTHVELLPVSEHPLDASWGYQPVGYYAPTSRFGSPRDFMYFVDYCHQHGIGVILDWVPAHFPKDGHGLSYFDGTHLYEHADPRKGEHPDWGTLIFNFGRNEVRNFLLSNALFWLKKYHIDGLRVDAVASMLYLDYSRESGQWIPNEHGGQENLEAVDFLRRFNELVHREFPGVVTVAEESTAWPQVSRPTYLGGLGFTLKWNMGWMHDMLRYMSRDPLYRCHHQNDITFSLLYAFTENFVLPLSHDEVVHGKRALLDKMPGDEWQRFANLRLFYGYMYGHPGKKLLFMGGEFGQWREWNHDSSLDWHLLESPRHRQLQRYVRDLNRLYASQPSLYEVDFDWNGFEWIDFQDAANSVIAFLRRGSDPGDYLIFICNFTPVPRDNYRIGVPAPGFYRELLNSDAALYGGSNVGNLGGVRAEDVPQHGRPYSLSLTLPPLATIVLKPTSGSEYAELRHHSRRRER